MLERATTKGLHRHRTEKDGQNAHEKKRDIYLDQCLSLLWVFCLLPTTAAVRENTAVSCYPPLASLRSCVVPVGPDTILGRLQSWSKCRESCASCPDCIRPVRRPRQISTHSSFGPHASLPIVHHSAHPTLNHALHLAHEPFFPGSLLVLPRNRVKNV